MLNKKYIINNSYLFDPIRKTLFDQSDESNKIILGNNENSILLTLIEKRSEVLSKDALNKSVWSDKGAAVYQSSVVQAISTLRKMLNDSTKNPSFILTVPKKGYQFIGSICDVVEKPLINKPAATRELPDNIENKVTVNKKTLPLIIPTILGAAVVLLCLSIFSIFLEKSSSNLIKVAAVNKVPIYSLINQSRIYTDNLLIKQAVTKILDKSNKDKVIDKVIVNLNSKNHLIINLIFSDFMKNKSYELIGNYGS